MKKQILLLSFLLFLSRLYAGEYLLSTERCSTFNSYSSTMSPAKLEIRYSTDVSERTLIKYKSIYFTLDEEAMKNFRAAIEKYFEWEEIAIKNEANIEKAIPIRINVGAIWTTWDDETCLGTGDFYFTFFSQNKKRHQFVISSTKINDVLSDYRDITLDNLYFDKNEVEQLYKDISEETLKASLEKVKQQQDVESLFN
jgi:hypothetical protein